MRLEADKSLYLAYNVFDFRLCLFWELILAAPHNNVYKSNIMESIYPTIQSVYSNKAHIYDSLRPCKSSDGIKFRV